MPVELTQMTESLKQFLADSMSDRNTSAKTMYRKFHNLRIFMDPEKNAAPHFVVRMGISEATYSVPDGGLMSGGMGGLGTYVSRWISRSAGKFDTVKMWEESCAQTKDTKQKKRKDDKGTNTSDA